MGERGVARKQESPQQPCFKMLGAAATHPTPPPRAPPSLPSLLLLLLCLLSCGSEVKGLEFRYHSHQEVEEILVNVSRSYPSITRLYSIGTSVQDRELWVIAIGENPRDHVTLRPNVKYVGNMHGNEVVGREMLLQLVELLVKGWWVDDEVTYLLSTTTVHIMPTMNPDGFAMANTTDCEGVQGRWNANGLDLNRNFPDFFQENPHPIQRETQAIMEWINSTQFVLSANLHGGALVACYPFDSYAGHMNESRASLSPDDDVFKHLARTYSYAHGTMGKVPPCYPDLIFEDGICNGAAWYPLLGGMQDYNYIEASCYEITLELSCCKYPPGSELSQFWEDNKEALVDYLLQVHMGVKGVVSDVNNNTVQGAVIVVEGRELVPFRTSQYGEYWKLLLPGSYVLLVSGTGYQTRREPFEVRSGSVTRLDVTLLESDDASPAMPLPVPGLPCLLILTLMASLSGLTSSLS